MYSRGDKVYVKSLNNTKARYDLDPLGDMLISFLKKERLEIYTSHWNKNIIYINGRGYNYDINDLTTVKEEINLNIPYNFYPKGWYHFLKFIGII
jgi:hypothetical protein